MTVTYAVYEVHKRSYYEGGSSKWEELLFIHHDIDEIRSTLNELWENKDLWKIRGKFQMAFPVGGMRTNEWFNDGGGCAASGYYEIRERPTATLAGYSAHLQAQIDKREADRLEEQRQHEEADRAWEERKEADRKRKAEIRAVQERNERRRANYAKNKDEINAKRRKKYGVKAEQLRLEKEAAKARSDATYQEMHDWLTQHPNHTEKQWERAFNRILKKYEDSARCSKS